MKLYYNEADLKKALDGSQTLVTRDGKEYILIDGSATELQEFLKKYHDVLKCNQETASASYKKDIEISELKSRVSTLTDQVEALKTHLDRLQTPTPECSPL